MSSIFVALVPVFSQRPSPQTQGDPRWSQHLRLPVPGQLCQACGPGLSTRSVLGRGGRRPQPCHPHSPASVCPLPLRPLPGGRAPARAPGAGKGRAGAGRGGHIGAGRGGGTAPARPRAPGARGCPLRRAPLPAPRPRAVSAAAQRAWCCAPAVRPGPGRAVPLGKSFRALRGVSSFVGGTGRTGDCKDRGEEGRFQTQNRPRFSPPPELAACIPLLSLSAAGSV